MILEEPWARVLLFGHLVAGVCTVALVIHWVIRLISLLRGQSFKLKQAARYARWLLVAYVVCFVSGALLYPTYRIKVRQDYLEPDLEWAVQLFEVKEHWASLGLAGMLALAVLAPRVTKSISRTKRSDPSMLDTQPSRPLLPLVAGLTLVVLIAAVSAAVAGWYLTLVRAV